MPRLHRPHVHPRQIRRLARRELAHVREPVPGEEPGAPGWGQDRHRAPELAKGCEIDVVAMQMRDQHPVHPPQGVAVDAAVPPQDQQQVLAEQGVGEQPRLPHLDQHRGVAGVGDGPPRLGTPASIRVPNVRRRAVTLVPWPTTRSPRAGSGARRSWVRRSAARRRGTRARRLRTWPDQANVPSGSSRRATWRRRVKMASVLGEMKGAAMKMGQLASFIDTEFLPPEYAEIYQEQLAKLRTSAPAMPWDKVAKVLQEEYLGGAARRAVRRLRAGGVRRRFDRPGASRKASRRPRGRGQDPVPGRRRGARVRPAQRRGDHATGQGVRAGAGREGGRRGAAPSGGGGARLRVRGPEPADLRPRLPWPPVHLRPRRAHPPVAASGAGNRVRRGARLRGREAPAAGRSRPLRRDRLPVRLRLDLPPPAVQRRSPPW